MGISTRFTEHFNLKKMLICFIVGLTSWSTIAQQRDFHGFSFKEYASAHPDQELCLSASNTIYNQQTLKSLGILTKQSTASYLYFNAKPSQLIDASGNCMVDGLYFSFARPQALADSALVKHQINLVHQGLNGVDTAYTGKGIIMGVIDQGIDFNHPDFKTATGKTRVLRYWDHSVNGANPPQPYNYGIVWDSSSINAGTCTSLETITAHGTTVAGMAAGNARANLKNKGAAPEADLIVVETNFNLPN
jgi:subtilisin family serine protease